ncbi:ferrous iron transport protein A [Desulfovibrio sp. OttesenSCG-928-I05]|nr:ferrous iron transport protein A [Desulfovibrio sp. OttesenSCG-928-I05]
MAHECCLLDLPQGARGRIRCLDGDSAERSRLLSMGFTPGAEVEMRGGDTEGCRVLLRDCSVVLGGNVARHIVCESVSDPAHEAPHGHGHCHGWWRKHGFGHGHGHGFAHNGPGACACREGEASLPDENTDR